MKNRCGFTLVELLVSMSVGSTLLVLSIGMVHRVMHLETTSRGRAAVHRTAMRLATQFRHDVHRAEKLSLEHEEGRSESKLHLKSPRQADVTYTVSGESVVRLQQRAGEPASREVFSFPADFHIGFAELHRPHRYVLTVTRDTGLIGQVPQVEMDVEAVVGRLQHVVSLMEDFP